MIIPSINFILQPQPLSYFFFIILFNNGYQVFFLQYHHSEKSNQEGHRQSCHGSQEPDAASKQKIGFLNQSPLGHQGIVLFYKPHKQNHCIINFDCSENFMLQVFEDQGNGIVCYRDGKGELVCEGYDEGPRYIRHPSHKTYHQR